MADVKMTHVPYRGQAEAINDLLGGRLTTMALTTALALPQIKTGKLRALAVTAGQPISANLELPTIAQAANLPGYEVQPWTGVFVPADTPRPVVDRLAHGGS
jgi:tripartite-type tricarboxylate transporter receptor subunit TctC